MPVNAFLCKSNFHWKCENIQDFIDINYDSNMIDRRIHLSPPFLTTNFEIKETDIPIADKINMNKYIMKEIKVNEYWVHLYNEVANSVEDFAVLFDFWKSIADQFPNATNGGVDIGLLLDFEIIATKAVKNWIENNVKGAN